MDNNFCPNIVKVVYGSTQLSSQVSLWTSKVEDVTGDVQV